MVARTPPNNGIPQNVNGDGPNGKSPNQRADGVTEPRYPHLKDLQAKAEAEAKELGIHIPVRSISVLIYLKNLGLIDGGARSAPC